MTNKGAAMNTPCCPNRSTDHFERGEEPRPLGMIRALLDPLFRECPYFLAGSYSELAGQKPAKHSLINVILSNAKTGSQPYKASVSGEVEILSSFRMTREKALGNTP